MLHNIQDKLSASIQNLGPRDKNDFFLIFKNSKFDIIYQIHSYFLFPRLSQETNCAFYNT